MVFRSAPDVAVAARSFKVEVGRAAVTIVVDVAAVARPSRVPVRVEARPLRDDDDARSGPPLIVYVCEDQRCTLRSEVAVPLDGAPVFLEASLFSTGLALQLRHRGAESSCCSTSIYGRSVPVVATTDPAGAHVDVTRDGTTPAMVVVPVGETLVQRPMLMESYNGLIVADEGWHIGGLSDPRDETLRAFVKRGGIASVPSTFFGSTAPFADVPAPPAVEVSVGGGPSHLLRVPDATKLVNDGAGLYVVRPLGASREQQIAGLVAARPSLLQWMSRYSHEDSIPVRAAGAGLALHPHRGLAFFAGFLCVVGVALCVRSSRRRGWRAALASSALVSVVGLASLWIVERVAVPREIHTRVVAWVGAGAAWEVGVDAVRPRSAGEVTVSSPVPPVMATVLGEGGAAAEPRRSESVDANGQRTSRVTSTVSSSAALAVLWERPAPLTAPFGAPVEMKDGLITNHLDVPLRAIAMHRGARMAGALAPGAARAIDTFDRVLNVDETQLELSVMEQRLLREIFEACIGRLTSMKTEAAEERCGAAIAVLDDGTLLGIEVSP